MWVWNEINMSLWLLLVCLTGNVTPLQVGSKIDHPLVTWSSGARGGLWDGRWVSISSSMYRDIYGCLPENSRNTTLTKHKMTKMSAMIFPWFLWYFNYFRCFQSTWPKKFVQKLKLQYRIEFTAFLFTNKYLNSLYSPHFKLYHHWHRK